MHKLLSFISIFTFTHSVFAQVDNAASIASEKTLSEVIVIGDSIFHYPDKDVFRITKYMRRGSYNTAQMLDKVPGLSYNLASHDISYHGDKNVCLLVDSLPKDADYIKQLGHVRFDKVEIIHNPLGKYSEYDVIINLRTKSHYEGYENNTNYGFGLFPNDNNGKGKQLSNNAAIESFTYTKDKWNFVLYYSGRVHKGERNTSLSRIFIDNNYKESVVLNDDGTNNTNFIGKEHKIGTSIDYQFNKRNSVSVAYGLELNNNDDNTNMTYIGSNLDDSYSHKFHLISATKESGSRQGVGLYYRGGHKAWNYNLTFNYFVRRWDTNYALHRSTGYSNSDNRHQNMHHTFTQADINRRYINDKLYISATYVHFWREYNQYLVDRNNLLSNNTLKYHQVGTYISYDVNKNTSFHISAQVRRVNSHSYVDKDNYLSYTGSIGAYHKTGKTGWMRFNYICGTSNPSLSQISSYGTFTDTLMWSGGNPMLRTSINHKVDIKYSFMDFLTFKAGCNYSPRSFMKILDEDTRYFQNTVGGNEETTLPPITEPRDATYVTTPFIPMTTLRKK